MFRLRDYYRQFPEYVEITDVDQWSEAVSLVTTKLQNISSTATISPENRAALLEELARRYAALLYIASQQLGC